MMDDPQVTIYVLMNEILWIFLADVSCRACLVYVIVESHVLSSSIGIGIE